MKVIFWDIARFVKSENAEEKKNWKIVPIAMNFPVKNWKNSISMCHQQKKF